MPTLGGCPALAVPWLELMALLLSTCEPDEEARRLLLALEDPLNRPGTHCELVAVLTE